MNKIVKERIDEYIKEQEEKLRKKLEKEKKEDLLARGLYEIKYSDEYIEGYTYDKKSKQYICKVPFDVSDEDYEKIKKYPIIKRVSYSFICYIIGVLIIISGLLISIVTSINDAFILIGIWLSSFIIGSLYFILGIIISILNKRN